MVTTETQTELLTRTAIASWKQVIGRVDEVLSSTNDEGLEKVVAPGKNRILYLVGHLAAVSDRMLPLLGLGDRLHPEFDAEFLENPDSHGPTKVSAAGVRAAWTAINSKLTGAMEALKPEQWLERHNSVSEEDFAKDPLRNRLAVLLSRTNHASFHVGQIRLTQ